MCSLSIMLFCYASQDLVLAYLQLTFAFVVLPCLLLGYLGQAAYLMENHADTTQAFFSSVPSNRNFLTIFSDIIFVLYISKDYIIQISGSVRFTDS